MALGNRASLPRQAKHEQQGSIEPATRFGINRSDHATHPFTTLSKELVGHDLGSNPKAVADGGLNDWPKPRIWIGLHIGRKWTGEHCGGVFSKLVGLNDDAGTRPAQIAWDDHHHDIAAPHFHSLQS